MVRPWAVCRAVFFLALTRFPLSQADLKKDVPAEVQNHRIRITLSSRNVANLEKGGSRPGGVLVVPVLFFLTRCAPRQ